jgi:hypothetical protein
VDDENTLGRDTHHQSLGDVFLLQLVFDLF